MPPAEEYRTRLRDRQQTVHRLRRWDNRFATLRGVVFLGFVALLAYVLRNKPIPESTLAGPILVYWGLLIFHGRIRTRLELTNRAVQHYQAGLARMKDQWHELGSAGTRYRDDAHPYANDLDLFGPTSVFQLVSRCQTRLGEDTLAAWMKQPANADEIGSRQDAVSELAPNLDLRETLDVLHPPLNETRDQNLLEIWCEQDAVRIRTGTLLLSGILTAGIIAATIVKFSIGGPWSFLLGLLGVQIVILAVHRKLLAEQIAAVERACEGLPELVNVLALIERQAHESPRLKTVQQRLIVDRKRPSAQLARLELLANLFSNCMRNQFLAPIGLVFGMHLHLINRLATWKDTVGPHVAEWLISVGEWEALLSLAGHRYEFPENVFPQIAPEELALVGTQLRHPILGREGCVPNDLTMDADRKLLLISGSNMSGKSTLLRTVGVNAVLALAGGSVHANSLKLSVLQVGAAMRVSDSLADGKSLFYSVVTRLKEIVDLAEGERPLLYLIDEILPGTNSHDRRLGAEAVLRSLVAKPTLGLVTTHDLALTQIADSLDGRAANLHFEDHLEGGKMSFDYTLREGVVKKSNALELMKMIGLKVDLPPINGDATESEERTAESR